MIEVSFLFYEEIQMDLNDAYDDLSDGAQERVLARATYLIEQEQIQEAVDFLNMLRENQPVNET